MNFAFHNDADSVWSGFYSDLMARDILGHPL